MLRLVADENFNGHILSGLKRREPRLDVVRVQDCGLRGATDPDLLEWAWRESRIVISHDRRTLPQFVYQRIDLGLPTNGVFIVDDRMRIDDAIEDIVIAACCCDVEECIDRVVYIPL
jgi:predicted nuclease of predicted toxin-antitoxin system